MKRISLLLIAVLCSVFAVAQNGRIDLRSESKTEISRNDFKALRATFNYASVESQTVETAKGVFSEIAMEGTYPSGKEGEPILPVTHQLLAVPFGCEPTVSVINYSVSEYQLSDYGIGTLMPRQPSVRKDQKPEEIEFVYNEAAYREEGFSKRPLATIEVQGTLRGIRIGSLEVNPVSYDAVRNVIRVYNNIEIEVSFNGSDLAETERMLLSTYSPYFDVVYRQMFNYRAINDVYTDHPDLMSYPVHMIVVTPENYISTLQPWVNWKIQKGFDVNVVTTAQAGSNYNAIRSYVQNLYNTGVNNGKTPTFLVLVGDVAQVPNTTGSQSQKVTDLYYGSVDGDYFPDMFYSRMSAENTSQLQAIVNKILQYEQYTMPDPSYLNNVTLIAGWDSYWNPRVAQPTVNYATNYYYNTNHGFSNVYTYMTSGQYTGCYNTLSSGVGFVNYTAHGSETSWADPSLTVNGANSLTNTNKYFLAMGNCCLAANFGHYQPCFGEAMLRAENKAAYSYIGSCPSTYWYEDYYFGVGATHTLNGPTPTDVESTTGVYDAVWMDDTYNTVSSMVFVGNIAVCYVHTGGYSTHSNPTYYWQAYHVLGDGSVMPYRTQPTANTVSHTSTLAAGAATFNVHAQAGSYVGISKDNVLLGAALVPASGSVNVPITPVSSGNVKIVVTKPQRQPYSATVSVGGSSSQYNISATATPAAGGSIAGAGWYEAGQQCTLTATANNGYTFAKWTEGGAQVSTNATYTFTVSGNRNLVANFTPDTYAVVTSSNPVAGGTTTGGGNFTNGQQCIVRATPNSGYSFVNWTENGTQVSTNATYAFTVSGNRNLVANFAQSNYTVTTTAMPAMGGTTAGDGSYAYGASCTVTATANQGYAFQKWTLNNVQVSTDASYTFTVSSNCNLVAHFIGSTYTVTVSADPEMGTATGGGNFNYGQTCAVRAQANEHYVFEAWKENGNVVSTESFFVFDVTQDRNLEAVFVAETYEINVTVNPADGGTVTGAGTYAYGETVTLVAEANENLMYAFLRWTEDGNEVSTNETYTFTVEASRNLVAEFDNIDAVGEQNARNIRVYPNPATDKLNVECAEGIGELRIYNMLGALVYSQFNCGNKVTVSMEDLPNGVYFVHMVANDSTEIRRFVKE